jgi:excisionase family DNA binding protein
MSAAETNTTDSPLETAADVARRLNASERTVRRYVRSGVLPGIRIGGLLRFDRQDVEAFLDARRTAGRRA